MMLKLPFQLIDVKRNKHQIKPLPVTFMRYISASTI